MRLDRKELYNHLLALRPNLAEQTVKSYVSLLMNIYFDATRDGDTQFIETDWFGDNQDEIVRIIQTRPLTSRASILSPVSVIINDPTKSKVVRDELKKNVVARQNFANSGVRSKKQEENWISYEDVLGKWEHYLHIANAVYAMPENVQNSGTKLEFTKFIILSLTTGFYFPPRRSEWCSVKFRNYSDTENYLDVERQKFVLNKYKTAKYYGRTEIDIPDDFMTHLNHYLEVVRPKGDFLLSTERGHPLSNSRLTAILNEIFDKKVGTSMLRHIYKTSQNMNMPAVQSLIDEARKMGHGLAQSLQYIKNQR